MKKTIICLVLIMAMMFSVTSAFASKVTRGYCPKCGTDRSFVVQCPGMYRKNSTLYSHAVAEDIEICNYYYIQYNMQDTCIYCNITVYQYPYYHNHMEMHNCIIGARVVCME